MALGWPGQAGKCRGISAERRARQELSPGGRGRRPRRCSGWQRRGGLAERARVAAGRCAEHAAVLAAELGGLSYPTANPALLARSPAVRPIPATTSIKHLQENLDAQDLDLTPEDIQSIDSLAPENAAA